MRIDARIDFVDLGPQLFRIVVASLCAKIIERRIEHPQDVRGFVRDDRLLLLVPPDGDGDAGRASRVSQTIDLMKPARSVHGIRNHVWTRIERPAVLSHQPVHDGYADDAREPLEATHDERTMRPRTSQRYIKVVPVPLGYEHARTNWILFVGHDPVTEYGRRSPQDSFREDRFDPTPVPHPFDQLTHRRRLS